jgi:ankyrin repeat protein
VNAITDEYTALMAACQEGDVVMVTLLLAAGAHVHVGSKAWDHGATDPICMNPLYLVEGSPAVVKLLQSRGARPAGDPRDCR